MIEFHKIDVGSLSAISADLGTVNAGVINGVEINGSVIVGGQITGAIVTGGGAVLDGDGLTLQTGIDVSNRLKWDNGAFVRSYHSVGSWIEAGGVDHIALSGGGGAIIWDSSRRLRAPGGGAVLGDPNERWGNVYTNDINIDGTLNFDADSQGAGIGRPLVVASDGIVHGVNNGVSGSSGGFTFANGICVGMP